MNKMKEVANMLGVELGEEFKLKEVGGYRYKFDKNALWGRKIGCTVWFETPTILMSLLCSKRKIEWHPKDCEQCWFVYADIQEPQFETFSSTALDDSILLNRGLIFKTRDEAINKMKELGWIE